ncbi:MAG: aminotransferase class III-fold pyridoxal phosphate-dependent enzyme [Candidatus Aminicenantes bacterium]|jgi:glutamate-1-semialdehyde aminotransferase
MKKSKFLQNLEYEALRKKLMFSSSQSYLHFLKPDRYPLYFVKAKGPYVWDVDGNRFIDLFLGSGVIILGHGYAEQIERVWEQLQSGAAVTMRHPVELEIAQWFSTHMNFAQRTMFFKTGSEASHAAVRLAYQASGKPIVVSLGYHGWLPPFENVSGGELRVIQAEWNSSHLEKIFSDHHKKIAALIVSPSPHELNREFYLFLESLAKENGAYFIMDEIKSGFRIAFPCLSTHFKLEPDICLLGKAVSNGFPLTALVCKENFYHQVDFSFFSTFAGEPLSMIAAIANLNILEKKAFSQYQKYANLLFEEMGRILRGTGLKIIGLPTFWRIEYPSYDYSLTVAQKLVELGILIHPSDEVLISASHDQWVIDALIEGFSGILKQIPPG